MVGALAVGQIIAGIVIAHYGVEGTGFYGFPLSEIVPYSLARTWHVQMGMLWIATSWLATGLCLAPLVAGYEPRLQRLGVNVLLVALVVVVGGSMFGQALAIHQVLSENVPTSGSVTRATSTSTWAASGRRCSSWGCCSGSC